MQQTHNQRVHNRWSSDRQRMAFYNVPTCVGSFLTWRRGRSIYRKFLFFFV